MLKSVKMTRNHAYWQQIVLPTLLVACFGLFMTILVNRITEDERSRAKEAVALNAADHLTNVFSYSANVLEGMKALWLSSEEVKPDEFQMYAATVFDPANGIVALEWVDADSVVRYVYPLEGENLKAVGLDNKQFQNRMEPILRSKELRAPVMTAPIMLAQGFPGAVIYEPVYRGDEYLGAAVGVVRFSALFEDFVKSLPYKDYDVVLSSGGQLLRADGRAIYTTDGKRVTSPAGGAVADANAPIIPNDLAHRGVTTEFADQSWTVFLSPKDVRLPPITAMSAAVTCFVVVLAWFFLVELHRTRGQLERTLARERDFASLVSHQLRAPLTELNWMIDAAAEKGAHAAERAAVLDDMRKIVRQSVRTVTELLHISRIERGVMDVKREETTIATVIEDALLPLRDAAREKKVSFRIDVPPSLVANIDPGKVVEALRNIVDNAIKYGPSDETVAIAAREADGTVDITVTDRGPGIPEEIRGKIFDKASAFSKKGTTEGSGLGLYLSKNLIELTGGKLRFETSAKGTTFTVVLPSAEAA